MADDKRTRWSETALMLFGQDDELYCLTELGTQALMIGISTMIWKTRQIDGTTDFFDELYGDLNYRLMNPVDFCAKMIECIDTNTAVQSAFTQWAINNAIIDPDKADPDTYIIEQRFPAEARDEEIIPLTGCDLDKLWSGIFSIVSRLDDQARTILEIAITYNDIIERFGNFASAIPIIGNAISSAQKAVSEAIPDLYNLFNAYSSQANMEAIACAIFEDMCALCRYPTYEELWNAYATHAVSGLDDLSLLNVATMASGFVSAGTASAAVAYHTMIILELFGLYAGSKVGLLNGIDAIQFMAELGEDTPSDDWITLCNGCTPEYPSLMPTRCEDTLQLGSITQVDFKTWDIESEVFSTGSFVFFQDDQLRQMKINSLSVLSGAFNTMDSQLTTACTRTNRSLPQMQNSTSYGVTITRNVDNTNLFTIRVVFDAF